MTCRICLEEGGELIQPCSCRGTAANVHPECLIKWLNISGTESCEICKHEYDCE
jgi:E3 ubiquitin-protein ligase DOA10